MSERTIVPIGGEFCSAPLEPGMLVGEGQQLTEHERDSLWRLFVEIGRCWNPSSHDSANQKSSWLEFLDARTLHSPSYVAEYSNAIGVIEELIRIYGESNAFSLLLLRHGLPDGPPTSRLAHAKHFVVDEFIRVHVVSGGFKTFGGRNYNGYLGGSRYNEKARVRAYNPGSHSKA